MADIQSLLENSKSNMMNMLKNRKYYLAIFLVLVILLVVFALALYVNRTLSKTKVICILLNLLIRLLRLLQKNLLL